MIKLHLNGEPKKADLSRRLMFMSHDGILFFRAMGDLNFEIFLTDFPLVAALKLLCRFFSSFYQPQSAIVKEWHFHTFINTLSYIVDLPSVIKRLM